MHKKDQQYRSRGFKLINSTSFGESVFSAGFIQEIVKGDLFNKGNYKILLRKQRGKTLGGSPPKQTLRSYHVGPVGPTCRPPGP